jgi:hypothetical protein
VWVSYIIYLGCDARALLDNDAVTFLDQLLDAGRGECHAPLVEVDLGRNANLPLVQMAGLSQSFDTAPTHVTALPWRRA